MNQHVRKPLIGAKGGGKSGSKDTGGKESPNTLRSTATLKIVDLLGEGEIKGLVNGPRSIFFDDTPLMNEVGAWNFDGVSYQFRPGYPDQTYIPGFSSVEAETGVGIQLLASNPLIKTISDPDYSLATVTMRVPSLAKSDDNGNIGPNEVHFRIRVRYVGGAWQMPFGADIVISGKCNAPYDRSYTFGLPLAPSGNSAPWEIEVMRLSNDSDSVKDQRDLYWASYKGTIESKFSYPNSAVIGIIINGEQFGSSVPSRAYEVYGRIIKVPNNYDPASRSYSGLWNGTFKEAWTDNPAWVFYDIVTNDRFGLGEYIDIDQVDKWGLYEIAQYCDHTVPDGRGGSEPRFVFNGVVGDAKEAYDAMASIASCFRGMAYWSSGNIVTSQDSPKDPVVLAAPSNVIDGMFDRQSSALKARHTVAMVSWNDPDDHYRQTVEVVQNDDAILRYGYRDTTLSATGCTSRGQAHRMGLWTLLTELHETQTITYQAGLDHAGVRPGDIVAVQDPSQAGNDFAGRLKAASRADYLLPDHPVQFETGKTYSVSVQMPDGAIAETGVNIVVFNEDTDYIVLSPPLPSDPDEQAMYVITSSTAVPELYRVISIREAEPNIYEVTGLQYEPSKFDATDLGTTFEELDITDLPHGPLPQPTGIVFTEYLYQANGNAAVLAGATFGVTQPADARVTEFEWQYQYLQADATYTAWQESLFSNAPSVDLTNLTNTSYNVRVRSRSALGGYSAWTQRNAMAILGLFQPPPSPHTFRINVLGDTMTLTWVMDSMINVNHFEIRQSVFSAGVTWNSAVVLVDGIATASIQLPTSKGTFLVKSVSNKGVLSVDAAMLVSNISSLVGTNIVATLTENPTWTGTKSNVEISNGEVILSDLGTISMWDRLPGTPLYPIMFAAGGNYMFAETFDLGAPFTCRLSAAIDAYARGYRNAMSTWMSLSTMDTLSSGTPDNWGIELQIRTTVQNPALALWSDWTTFQSGFAQFRAAQFRIELLGLDPMVTPAIRALSVTIDMPDRIVSDQDVAVGTDGLFVNFVPNFKSLRGVSTGDQDMNTGDTKVIDIKNEAGFFIKFFDHTGAPVARTFDYNAVGYGEVSDLGILPDIPPGYSFLGQNYSGPGDTDFQYILYFGALISIPPGIAS